MRKRSRTSSGRGTKSSFATLTTILIQVADYKLWYADYKMGDKNPDRKFFASEKCITDDKLRVTEDIVHCKNSFF